MKIKVKLGVSTEAVDCGIVAKPNLPANTEGLTENQALGSMSEKVFSLLTIGKTCCK